MEAEGCSSCLSLLPVTHLGALVFLVSTTLGSMALEVLVLRRACFYQEAQEESLVIVQALIDDHLHQDPLAIRA